MEIQERENRSEAAGPLQKRNRRFTFFAWGCLLLMTVLSAGLFWLLRENENQQVREGLEFESSAIAGNLQHIVEYCRHAFYFLEGWHSAAAQADASRFHGVLRPFLLRHPFLQALEWIPRVPRLERARYEQCLREEGYDGFQFHELDETGRFRPAGEREEYFPVYFVEPHAGNEAALGFDLASDPDREEPLKKSRETGRMVASRPIRLVQEPLDQMGFLLYYPVYREAGKGNGEPAGEGFEGFFLGVFRAGDMLSQALVVPHSGLDIFLYDVTTPDRPQLLAAHRYSDSREGIPENPPPDFFRERLHVSRQFEVGARAWRIYCLPGQEDLAGRKSIFVWLVPGGVLLLGFFLFMHLRLLHGKNEKITAHAAAMSRVRKELEAEVAERIQAETALQGVQEELQQIFDSAPFYISFIDKEMRVLRLNPCMEQFAGLKTEAARGRHCYDLWGQYADDPERLGTARVCDVCLVQKTLTDGQSHKHLRQLEGGQVVEVVSSPVRNEHGDIVGAMELGSDVSERERAAQALRESEANYRTLFESAPCVIAIADFSGIKEHLERLPLGAGADYDAYFRNNPQEVVACLHRLRIFEVNQAALQVFGAASRQEVIDSLFRIIGPETAPYTVGALSAIGRGRPAHEHEIVLYRLSGALICGIIRWQVVPGYEKNYQKVILSFTDITSRKEAENTLVRQKARMQELARRLVEVEEAGRRHIARELHDKLGQQLTALGINLNVLGGSEWLKSDSSLARRFADSLALLEGMTEQVRDIMAELRPPVLDDWGLGAALRWYGALFSQRTGITVGVTALDLPRFPLKLELTFFRVAQEALTNVAKHSGASEVEIHCQTHDGSLIMEITDNGRGFEVTKGNNMPGAGLGLICMRERVQAVGGGLRIESQPGAGASLVAEVEI